MSPSPDVSHPQTTDDEQALSAAYELLLAIGRRARADASPPTPDEPTADQDGAAPDEAA